MQLGGTAIFCDIFSTSNPGIQSRTGGLDPNVWGVSRIGGLNNAGQGMYNTWLPTALVGCNGTTTVVNGSATKGHSTTLYDQNPVLTGRV